MVHFFWIIECLLTYYPVLEHPATNVNATLVQLPNIKKRRRTRLEGGLRNWNGSYRRLIGIWNTVARKAVTTAWREITFALLLTARLIMHRLRSRPCSPRYSMQMPVIDIGSPRKSEDGGVQVRSNSKHPPMTTVLHPSSACILPRLSPQLPYPQRTTLPFAFRSQGTTAWEGNAELISKGVCEK